jgi:hypothetical protein
MTEDEALTYVQAAAAALALPLDAAQAQRVAIHLARTAALAALLDGVEMAPHDEIAEIYDPTGPLCAVDGRGVL